MKVHIAQVARSQISTWIRQTENEIGGLLLGRVQKSGELTRRVRVEAAIYAEGAELVGNTIRFTAELLADLTDQAKREYPTFQPIGWFHTHNGLGAFFSSYDKTVHKEHFPYPWQIALVIDPELAEEAIYVWQDQEIVLYTHASEPELHHLVAGSGKPSGYRLANPRRLLAVLAFAVILVAASVGAHRWIHKLPDPNIPDPPPQGQVETPAGPELPEGESMFAIGDNNSIIDEPEPVSGTSYIVKPNDTLWEISRRFYGEGMYFGFILDHNQIDDPRELSPGQTLVIPDKPADDS